MEGAQRLRARRPEDAALPVTLVQLLLARAPPADAAAAPAAAGAGADGGAAEGAALALLHDETLIRQLAQVQVAACTALPPKRASVKMPPSNLEA